MVDTAVLLASEGGMDRATILVSQFGRRIQKINIRAVRVGRGAINLIAQRAFDHRPFDIQVQLVTSQNYGSSAGHGLAGGFANDRDISTGLVAERSFFSQGSDLDGPSA